MEKEEFGRLKLDDLSTWGKNVGKIYDVCVRLSRILSVKLLSNFNFRKRRNLFE